MEAASYEIVVAWNAGTETLRVVAVNVNGAAVATDDVRTPSPATYPFTLEPLPPSRSDAPAGIELRVRWTILAESAGPVRVEVAVRNRVTGAVLRLDGKSGIQRDGEPWRGEAKVDAP